MNGHQNHYNQNGSQRPHSEMIHSPMSEIHPVGPTSISRNGMPPRPNSVLEDPSYFPPLSPPPDFHSGKNFRMRFFFEMRFYFQNVKGLVSGVFFLFQKNAIVNKNLYTKSVQSLQIALLMRLC